MGRENLLIDPTYVEGMSLNLSEAIENNAVSTEMAVNTFDKSDKESLRIAVIPVEGYLAHKVGFRWAGYLTGYGYIDAMIDEVENDASIDAVVFDINSGGGMVSGAFETAANIRAMTKPTAAIVDAHAYSAAYLMASACDTRYVPKTGGVGSIGVVTSRTNLAKMYEKIGIKVEFFYAGKFKVEGNPYEDMSDDARKRIQKSVEKDYELFTSTVADYTGMTVEAVKTTEAATYQGDEAVEVGLADYVMSPKEAYSHFASLVLDKSEVSMSKQTEDKGAVSPESQTNDASSTAQLDANALRNEGAMQERERIQSIMSCDEAEGRGELASHLAFSTDMNVEAVSGILAASPKVATTSEKGAEASTQSDTPLMDQIQAAAGGGAGVEAVIDKDDSNDASNAVNDVLAHLQGETK